MPNLKRFPVHSLPRQVSFAILKIMRRVLLILTAILVLAAASRADTLHLKDGSTVTGIIVGFDQNSFRVKTSYGLAVVRRDAVVSIDVAKVNSVDKKRPAAEKKPPAPAATPHVEKPASTTPAPAPGQPAVKPATSSPPAQPTNAAAISPKPVDKTAHSEPAATSSNAPKDRK